MQFSLASSLEAARCPALCCPRRSPHPEAPRRASPSLGRGQSQCRARDERVPDKRKGNGSKGHWGSGGAGGRGEKTGPGEERPQGIPGTTVARVPRGAWDPDCSAGLQCPSRRSGEERPGPVSAWAPWGPLFLRTPRHTPQNPKSQQ